jgi:hypothetical protein
MLTIVLCTRMKGRERSNLVSGEMQVPFIIVVGKGGEGGEDVKGCVY